MRLTLTTWIASALQPTCLLLAAQIRSMLDLAEKELEARVSETTPFKNIKRMLQQKNDVVRDLRRRLSRYERVDDEPWPPRPRCSSSPSALIAWQYCICVPFRLTTGLNCSISSRYHIPPFRTFSNPHFVFLLLYCIRLGLHTSISFFYIYNMWLI